MTQRHTVKKARAIVSTLVNKNVTVHGRRTSVRLEPVMWTALAHISLRERLTRDALLTAIAAAKRDRTSLTTAIRVFIVAYFQDAATEEGHKSAGHGALPSAHTAAALRLAQRALQGASATPLADTAQASPTH